MVLELRVNEIVGDEVDEALVDELENEVMTLVPERTTIVPLAVPK